MTESKSNSKSNNPSGKSKEGAAVDQGKSVLQFEGLSGERHAVEIPPVSAKGELLAVGGVFAVILAFSGAIAWWDNKKARERREENLRAIEEKRRKRRETEEWINAQNNSGKFVVALEDGRFMTVPLDTKYEFHLKD